MRKFAVIVGSLVAIALLLGIAAFCVFGFMVSAEAAEAAWAFRTMYGAIGVGCLGLSVALAVR
jgi:hypothetical protein